MSASPRLLRLRTSLPALLTAACLPALWMAVPMHAQTLPSAPLPTFAAVLAERPALPLYMAASPMADVPQQTSAQLAVPASAQQPTAATHFNRLPAYDYAGNFIVRRDRLGSTYIPVDSWMYPALLRLYSMGYIDTATLSLRPWTRRSVLHMLDRSQSDILFDNRDEAVEILDKLYAALRDEPSAEGEHRGLVYGADSAYVGVRAVHGTVLRDSWHLGQSFNNDYGRPYSNGFNTYDGASGLTEWGPLSLYVRGEFQHAPAYQGYSLPLAQQISLIDGIVYNSPNNMFGGLNYPQATIPEGTLPAQNNFRLLEANVAVHAVGHEISFGKSDAWMGPGMGSMAWSNNAENMYAFRINRVEPLHIPYVSRVLGNIRYDFFIGSLQGHTYPRGDYAHAEQISFTPWRDFQVGLARTIVWGGEDHEPITLHTFLKGFFEPSNVSDSVKYSRDDPGARFTSINFAWRLPWLRQRVTLYTDSTTHDDPFPLAAPRRAGWRPGLYIAQLPHLPKMDLRVEATYTDYVTTRSIAGQGNYYEAVQRQAYTNKGFIMGDWIGREAKGGQAWLTYHLSGNEWITLQYLRKKNAKDFIAGGTTQNIYRVDVVKRLRRNVELNAWFQSESWKAPIWKTGQQGSTTGAFQVTWFPKLKNRD